MKKLKQTLIRKDIIKVIKSLIKYGKIIRFLLNPKENKTAKSLFEEEIIEILIKTKRIIEVKNKIPLNNKRAKSKDSIILKNDCDII